jgi:hypothetical protein
MNVSLGTNSGLRPNVAIASRVTVSGVASITRAPTATTSDGTSGTARRGAR